MPGEQPTQQQTLNSLQTHDNESIRRTAKEIAEITNGKDDTEQKVQLEGILTTEFANKLDSSTATILLEEANKAKDAKGETYTELDDLIAFLEPIAKPHNTKGELDDIDEGNNKTTRDYYDTYFGESGLLSMIPENYNNEQILKIKEELTSINSILNNITQDNVKKLQKFLWENVTNGQLRSLNGENAPQTGNFAKKTQADLKTFLDNTKNYIENYNKHQEIAEKGDKQKKQEIQDATNAVNGLTNPTQESYDEAKQKYNAAKEKYGNSFDSDNKISQTLNTAGEELQKQQEREKASKSTMSFNTLSQKLNTFNDSEINGILAQQIKPLNEKLKQGPSINELNAKISELKGKINSYDKDGQGLDNKDKKGNRKTINDLQNELKQVEKELNNKRKIKEDLSTQLSRIKDIIKKISSPDNTENEIILKNIKDFYGLQNDENTSIIKKENEQEQDRTPFSQYERSLDDIGNGKEPSNETTQGESSPEQTAQTQTPEQAQKAVNKPRSVNTGLSARFDKVGFKRDENVGFWKNIWNALGAVFGSYFGFSMKGKESGTTSPEQKSDDLKIDLTQFESESESEIKTTLGQINNITQEFNGRKEIVDTINSKDSSKIANLQRKLRTFPVESNGTATNSPINITGKIDKATAEGLKNYVNGKSGEQNNNNPMEYNFCNGYTACETKISKDQGELFKKNDGDEYILIQKDESGNISSITKGQLLNGESVNENPTTIPTFDTKSAKVYKLGTEGNNNTSIVENNYTVPSAT